MTKKIIVVIFIVVAALAITAASFEVAFADQLPYGVYIDGKAYPKANRTILTKAISDSVISYEQSGINFTQNDKTKVVKLSELGISFDIEATADKAFSLYSSNYPLAGTVSLVYAIATQKNKVSLTTSYNEPVFKEYVQKSFHPFFDTPAVDATLSFDKIPTATNPESDGKTIDDKALRLIIDKTIANHDLTLTVPLISDTPDVKTSDLSQAAKDADQLLGRKITLTAGSKKIVPKREEMAGWLSIISESNILRTKPDSSKVESYLNKLAPTVNKKAQNQITDTSQTVLTVGVEGLSLNITKSVQAIMDGLVGDKISDSIALVTTTTDYKTLTYDPQEGGTAGLAEGKYVEINLSKQKMYLYEGLTFINSFGVSTGKWSTPTPTGTFQIYNKISKAYSKPYDLYMPYWSAITADGQYGIHGLPFKGSWIEGANHIGTPVSHGCVRLGPGNDSNVYDWAVIGTPVFIHK